MFQFITQTPLDSRQVLVLLDDAYRVMCDTKSMIEVLPLPLIDPVALRP